MKYLKWKKEVRKSYSLLSKQLNTKLPRLVLPKKDINGAMIYVRSNKIVLPFYNVRKQKNELYKSKTMVEISDAILCHELGHFIDFLEDKELFHQKHRKRHTLLRAILAYDPNYTKAEKYEFIMEYKKEIHDVENKGWNLGFSLFNGDPTFYDLIKRDSINTYLEPIEENLRELEEIT